MHIEYLFHTSNYDTDEYTVMEKYDMSPQEFII